MIGAGLVLLASLAVVARQAGDEPPIRVRNGSMIFELESGAWVPGGGNWTPPPGANRGTMQVVIVNADGYDCTGRFEGTSLQVTYDQRTIVTLNRAGNGRTVLSPGNVFDLVPGSNGARLRHGQDGTGHITQFVIRSAGQPRTCSATRSSPRPTLELRVCTWDSSKPC
jgi:hypothetical protein